MIKKMQLLVLALSFENTCSLIMALIRERERERERRDGSLIELNLRLMIRNGFC